MDGLSTFVRNGGDPARVCSVASFVVSRIDTMVDGMIETGLATATDPELRASLTDLLGTVAIANARLAYQRYQTLCRTAEWQRLGSKGAHPQRLLWASTSTKNPRYRDVRYVEELIGRDTVNTITPATLEAFRDHGRLRASLEENIEDARARIGALDRVGISLNDVTDRLLDDGVTLFCKAFDSLLAVIDMERRSESTPRLDR
jgi:transaldolase/glucose-6-phosphate isomerase